MVAAPAALNQRVYHCDRGARSIDSIPRRYLRQRLCARRHVERTEVLQYFDRHAEQWGLTKDIAFVRHPREQE
ncbi:MAG: hypothetical protein U0231_00685 [Nitrospiraceae bacterium]